MTYHFTEHSTCLYANTYYKEDILKEGSLVGDYSNDKMVVKKTGN